MTINLTVILEAKSENSDKLKGLLQNLVIQTKEEIGCLQYDLYQNSDNVNEFILHEIWENKAAFDFHNSREYIKDFFKNAPIILSKTPRVIFTNKIA